MKNLVKSVLAMALVTGFGATAPFSGTAHASNAEGDYQRAVTCRQLRQAGRLQWYSIASGTVNTGTGRGGYSGFVTKACHTNRASCEQWVRYVGREINNLDTLETAYCRRAR